jgi:hypothetical protein
MVDASRVRDRGGDQRHAEQDGEPGSRRGGHGDTPAHRNRAWHAAASPAAPPEITSQTTGAVTSQRISFGARPAQPDTHLPFATHTVYASKGGRRQQQMTRGRCLRLSGDCAQPKVRSPSACQRLQPRDGDRRIRGSDRGADPSVAALTSVACRPGRVRRRHSRHGKKQHRNRRAVPGPFGIGRADDVDHDC